MLDSFEHLLEATPLIAELVDDCPAVTFLVTSRAVLHVYGEHDFVVPPLALPAETLTVSQETLLQNEATHLFVERSRAANQHLAITTPDAEAIAEICRLVDGLPLAIELAAARLRHLSPRTLIERMHPMLPLLSGGARDLPERHQTLEAAIAWSYGLLDEQRQRLLRTLGVFTGGWSLDAAGAVCGEATNDLSLLDDLAVLVDNSLIQLIPHETETRYTML